MKVAITGASGFVGSRLHEVLVLGHQVATVPVVRAFRSLARPARFGTGGVVCPTFSVEELADAFTGCNAVVHTALGDAGQIVAMADKVYDACARAGVRTLVSISTGCIWGYAPAPATTDTTPPNSAQRVPYNDAKARAEEILNSKASSGPTAVVHLRPMIIYGPRSNHITRIAQELRSGTAYVVEEGQGICNAVYVDNLIQAIWQALQREHHGSTGYIVGDLETVTWLEFYSAIARELSIDPVTIHRIELPQFVTPFRNRVMDLMAKPAMQRLLPLFPGKLKMASKRILVAMPEPPSHDGWALSGTPGPLPAEDICRLQQCRWNLPIEAAREQLGYQPFISQAEGIQRSIAWWNFARGMCPAPDHAVLLPA